MAKLTYVKCAKKAIPEAGIEVGQPYWWYKKRVSGKGVPRRCSKTKPRRSAYATSSPFIGGLMDMEDDFNKMLASMPTPDEVAVELRARADNIEGMKCECEDKAANVGSISALADSPSVNMLRERAEHCEALAARLRDAASELEGIQVNTEDMDDASEDEQGAIASAVNGIEWLP